MAVPFGPFEGYGVTCCIIEVVIAEGGGRPHHWGTIPLLFFNYRVGSFISPLSVALYLRLLPLQVLL